MMRVALAAGLFLGGAAAAFGEGGCTVGITTANGHGIAALSDLEALFPDFQTRADKGVAVTMEHHLRLHESGGDTEFAFGCTVTFDLWDKVYAVVAFGDGPGSVLGRSVITTLSGLPRPCKEAALPTASVPRGTAVDVVTVLDPVSPDQVAKTRSWLAERGIGSASPAIVGRAVAALVDLKEERRVERRCLVP